MDKKNRSALIKMKRALKTAGITVFSMLIFGCTIDGIRNIAGPKNTEPEPLSTEVNPVDINDDGFDLLERMQGHWVGRNRVIADDYEWFAFDYRANSSSQVHGIFEGGSMGNLFTSFFITDFKEKRTIMARNGGVLSGIYRTSYFVLDKVETGDNGKYYRLVDAIGGAKTMYMELRFKEDSLYFNSYTSRLGLRATASRHMTFKAKKTNIDLAQAAAQQFQFPQNIPAWDFSTGFDENNLYVNPGDAKAKSASFLAQAQNNDVFTLAQESGDPWRIDQHPNLSILQLNIERNATIDNASLLVNLSKEALTDSNGFYTANQEAFDSILLFSELSTGETEFLITYLHPGTYNVNITADMNDDGIISTGDITHANKTIVIDPEEIHEITIDNIIVEN